VVRGIPRFVASDEDNYAESFGRQWARWSRVQFDEENENGPMRGHTSMMFERIVGSDNRKSLSQKVVLDVGVGAGRFADVVVRAGGKVIGIDLSSAVEVARKNLPNEENCLICQADALNLPIRSEAVDAAYSIGVLHHTPSPFSGLSEMFRAVKRGGWCALAVYQKGGYYDSLRVKVWRTIFRGLARFTKQDIAPYAYAHFVARYLYRPSFVPVLGHTIRGIFPSVRLPDERWRILDTFDSVTPAYQSAHTGAEVRSWFEQIGANKIYQSDWGSSTWRGVK
jgi:ubiquinone/menaquinone biosynthesis C-methylase UbiE